MRFAASPSSGQQAAMNDALAAWSPLLAAAAVVCYWRPPDELDMSGSMAKRPYMVWDSGRLPPECQHVVFFDIPTVEIKTAVEAKGRLQETQIFIIKSGSPLDLDEVHKLLSMIGLAGVHVHSANKTYNMTSSLYTGRNTPSDKSMIKEVENNQSLNNYPVKVVYSYCPCTKVESEVDNKNMMAIHTFVRILIDTFNFNIKTHPNDGCDSTNWLKGLSEYKKGGLFSIQELNAGHADADMAGWVLEYQRYDLVDYGPVYSMVYYTYAIRRPVVVGNYGLEAITKLLTSTVWLGVLLGLLTASLIYWLIRIPQLSFFDSVFALLALQLLTGDRPVRSAAGCVLLGFCFYAIVMTTAFTADLLNRIVLPTYSERVDTIDGVENGNYHELNITKYRNMPTIEEARDALDKELLRSDKGVLSVIKERYIEGKKFTLFLSPKQISKFRHIKESRPFEVAHVGIIFKKDFLLKLEISKAVQQMLEVGLYDYAYRHQKRSLEIRRMSVNEDEPSYDVPMPLGVNNLKPLFYLLAFGVALSLVILALEIAHFHATNYLAKVKRNRNTSPRNTSFELEPKPQFDLDSEPEQESELEPKHEEQGDPEVKLQ